MTMYLLLNTLDIEILTKIVLNIIALTRMVNSITIIDTLIFIISTLIIFWYIVKPKDIKKAIEIVSGAVTIGTAIYDITKGKENTTEKIEEEFPEEPIMSDKFPENK